RDQVKQLSIGAHGGSPRAVNGSDDPAPIAGRGLFAIVHTLVPGDVPPVAVAAHEIVQLPVGFLRGQAALLEDPAGEAVASPRAYREVVAGEPAPLFLQRAAELQADAVDAVVVHVMLVLWKKKARNGVAVPGPVQLAPVRGEGEDGHPEA